MGYKSLAFWFFWGEFYFLLIYGVLGYCFHIKVFFLIIIWCYIQVLAYVIWIVVIYIYIYIYIYILRLTISLRFIGGNCWVLREAILIVVHFHLQPIAFDSWKLHLLLITHGGLNALLIFQEQKTHCTINTYMHELICITNMLLWCSLGLRICNLYLVFPFSILNLWSIVSKMIY